MTIESPQSPILYLLCGKIAAGKSTLAHQLAASPGTVLISEDVWLSRLYTDEIRTIADYVRRSSQLRAALDPHIESLLRGGLSVVLDFPANTLGQRQWMKDIIDRTGTRHELHHLDITDAVCKMRLKKRNASGEHPYAPTDAEFDAITRHFVPPSEAEGFHVVRHER